MALGATIYNFDVQLSDVDRNVYEALSFKAAQHPSESAEYLLTRVLAYCLEYAEGIAFSNGGVSEPDAPAIAVRDLTGTLTTWIEIGSPDAARLHRASKAAPRLVVYTHRTREQFLRPLAGEKIHRAEEIDAFALDRNLLAGLAERLDRRMKFDLSVNDGHLFLSLGERSFEGSIEKISLTNL
jgi:uncharacterized protein YaeQ